MKEEEKDCRNCKNGYADDHWGIPMCHINANCWGWEKWEPKENRKDNKLGRCENCDRLLYDHSTRYYVRFRRDSYCFCENCVTVIEPEKDGVTNDE